jgi:hypothetical protein
VLAYGFSKFGSVMRIHDDPNCSSPTGWKRDEVCGAVIPAEVGQVVAYYVLNALSFVASAALLIYGGLWLLMKVTGEKEWPSA